MIARRRIAPLGVAVGGVLTGHWLTYLILSPHARSRAAMLRATGHAYLGFANDVALVLALAALAALFVGQLAAEGKPGLPVGITRRIVAFQVSAFVLMEVLERVTAGAPLGTLVHTGVLPLGILVQAGIGLVAAVAIRGLLRVAERVAAALARPKARARRRQIVFPLPEGAPARRQRSLSATGVRGPPLPV